ncbi:DMT family transporter [Hydrogenophaga sp.]|uniref:DMT family transporter n=1 Tax=Hydrogenophaga sp. TaxID=1904254 RepID=UPI003F6FD36C
MSPRRRAMLLMLGFVTLWALIEAMAAHVLRRYSPYQVVWTRYAVHLLLMLLVWGWRQPATLWRTGRPVFQLARSLLMLGMPASWIIGTQLGVQGNTLMAIFWLSPLFIVVLSHLFLRERASAPVWAATGIACLGALLMHEPGALSPPGLLLFPFGMALCFSLYVVMTRSLRSETTRTNLFYTALGVFLVLTPFMPAVWQAPQSRDLLVMVGIGVLGYATLYLLDRMAAAAPLSVSAPFAYLQVAFTVVLLAGMGHHDMSIRRIALGLVLIGGAALFVWMREPQLQVREAAAARPIS